RRGEERAKSSPRRIGVVEIVLLEHARKKLLREIPRLVGAVSLPANERVDRIPVRLAEAGERLGGSIAALLAGRQHQAPARRQKAMVHGHTSAITPARRAPVRGRRKTRPATEVAPTRRATGRGRRTPSRASRRSASGRRPRARTAGRR